MENLGFDPPMGSTKQIFIVAIYTLQFWTWTPLKLNPNNLSKAFYLNEGTGEPCTGQTRLALFDILDDNLASIMLDLLGLELPMGSEEEKYCVIEFY